MIGLLVGGFYYFFRFVTRKVGIQMLGRDVVQVLSVVPIGQNKYLQVVDLAGRVLVLGVTDSNINFITEITGEGRDRPHSRHEHPHRGAGSGAVPGVSGRAAREDTQEEGSRDARATRTRGGATGTPTGSIISSSSVKG